VRLGHPAVVTHGDHHAPPYVPLLGLPMPEAMRYGIIPIHMGETARLPNEIGLLGFGTPKFLVDPRYEQRGSHDRVATMDPGGIPAACRGDRRLVSLALAAPLPFVDIDDTSTLLAAGPRGAGRDMGFKEGRRWERRWDRRSRRRVGVVAILVAQLRLDTVCGPAVSVIKAR
jgi:hypothetical protein